MMVFSGGGEGTKDELLLDEAEDDIVGCQL